MSRPACTFDASSHRYTIAGKPVVNVTAVLRDLLPSWSASDWHLQRGQAVHAAAAMVGRGQQFTHDLRIAGQVEAARKFYREVKPEILAIEKQVYATRYLYAGTLDLQCRIAGRLAIADFKSSLTPTVPIQCAAYALAEHEADLGLWWGVGIELRDDGTYRMSEMERLKPYSQEWLALLTTYRVRQRLGLTKGEESND
jgi:hypothetical protein